MKSDANPSITRLLAGFLLAPMLPTAVIVFSALAFHGMQALPALLFGFVYCLTGCYVLTVVVAVPAYAILRRFFRIGPALCVACGFLIGAAVLVIPFLLQLTGVLPMFDSYQQGTHMIVVNRRFTDYGIYSSLLDAAEAGVFGAAIASIFWVVAYRTKAPGASLMR